MMNASLSPIASKNTWKGHVRAVYYQARAFTKNEGCRLNEEENVMSLFLLNFGRYSLAKYQ